MPIRRNFDRYAGPDAYHKRMMTLDEMDDFRDAGEH